MKKFYIAVTVEQNINDCIFTDNPKENYNPGYYAYVISCTASDNLKSVLQSIGGLLHANIFPTKKEARAAAELWNNSYKINKTYLFSDPVF